MYVYGLYCNILEGCDYGKFKNVYASGRMLDSWEVKINVDSSFSTLTVLSVLGKRYNLVMRENELFC